MNHTVTVGGLLAAIVILIGLGVGVFGCLAFMAGGMSDAPEAGDAAGRTGCICMAIGAASVVAAFCWLSA